MNEFSSFLQFTYIIYFIHYKENIIPLINKEYHLVLPNGKQVVSMSTCFLFKNAQKKVGTEKSNKAI